MRASPEADDCSSGIEGRRGRCSGFKGTRDVGVVMRKLERRE